MVVNIVYHIPVNDASAYEFMGIDGNGVVVFSGHESLDGVLYGMYGREMKKSAPKSGLMEESVRIFAEEFGLIVNKVIYF